MKGNRPSSLPIVQFCSKSAAINVGAGRAAAMSSVWHARAAGSSDWKQAYDRLTTEEQDDVDSWLMPTDVIVGDVTLRFADAKKETECGLTADGGFALKSSLDALTAGHCDFYWLYNRTLFVGDLKKSEYTNPDGPRSLQILCYALALAAAFPDSVDGVVCGIWHATEGTWEWGEYIALDSAEALDAWNRVKAAALNVDGDYSTGPHCRGCYSRGKCPAYLLPPDQAESSLARYFTGDLDVGRAYELLVLKERAQEMVKTADKLIKAAADMFGGIPGPDGKVYRPVECKGRASLDAKALEADNPELVQKYTRMGKPYSQFRWCAK